jgi:hypothetical protein
MRYIYSNANSPRQVMEHVLQRLDGVDPLYREMVVGLDIGRKAGYKKPRHFLASHYYGAAITTLLVAPGVVSCQGSAAHWYFFDGQYFVTHPDSACAAKENVRRQVRLDPARRLRFEAIRWARHHTDVGSGSVVGPSRF